MQFGSVAFFKALIKTVLCILFFVPLVLCVVFAVLFWNSSADVKKLEYENEKLKYMNKFISGQTETTVENFYDLYAKFGLSDEELVKYVYEKTGVCYGGEDNENPDVSDDSSINEIKVPVTTPHTSPEPVQETQTVFPTEETETAPPIPTEESPYADLYADLQAELPENVIKEQGTVYLTFDDGPSVNTYSVLHYLDKYGVKATFFVVPQRTEECYELMRMIVNNGHSIGVHSASHDYQKIYASVEAFLDDFYEAWSMIYEATGVKTGIFRFPGGSQNDFNTETRDDIIEEMTRRGFRYFDWNVESRDVDGATWSEMYRSIPADIAEQPRAIVLMHDSAPRENTVYVLEDIIKKLLNDGYKLDKIRGSTCPIQFIGPYA